MNFPKKVKKVIQVVDATISLQESDEHHGGRTTIKRKEMVELQNEEEREQSRAERLEKQDARKMAKYGNNTLGELSMVQMTDLRGELNEMTKDKMTKAQQKELKEAKLKKIGAVVHHQRHHRKNLEKTTKNQLKRDVEYYKEQKEIGMAVGIANPRAVHQQKMYEKYGKKHAESRSLKLHSVGKMDRDGTLKIGAGAMKRTEEHLRKSRSGGTATNKMFKQFNK